MTEIHTQRLTMLGDMIGDRLGLRLTPDRHKDLERSLARAAKDAGFSDTGTFVDHLLRRGIDEHYVQSLAWHLTVGETYFFRQNSAFDILEHDILPRLIAHRRNGSRRLRIWSAGCSTGEEPYSLAMLCTRLLPDLADWQLTILATDINTQSLAKAEKGVYTEWSFRDVPDTVRTQCFKKVGDKGWAVLPRIRRLVKFSYLNLATDTYPARATDTTAMDVIFCRNVLMYLRAPLVKSVAGKLHAALVDDGCLFVTPSEASAEYFPQYARMTERGEIYFKKTADKVAGAAKRRAPVKPATPRPAPQARPATPRPAPAPSRTAQPKAKERPAGPPPPPPAPDPAQAARAAADRGDLEEALKACEQAIAREPCSAELRYLNATILDEMGHSEEAVQAIRSALYLDADLVVAHFLLGNIARGQGKKAVAARHLRRALELLEKLAPEQLVPAADGLSASELTRIAESLLVMEVSA